MGRVVTGPQHYREAERLIAEVAQDDGSIDFGEGGEEYVAVAQVHATLALAAATALMRDMDGCEYNTALSGWNKAAGTA